jgi:DNA-binding PadR family transcriptional regulator
MAGEIESEYFGSGEPKRRPEDLNFQEVQFPSDPYDRLGHILGGVINMAPKSILVYSFPMEEPYETVQKLTETFHEYAFETPFENIRRAIIQDYYEHSLQGAGLVAKAVDVQRADVEVPVGYALTEAGKIYGKRAAALALRLEGTYPDIDIYQIFGATASTSEKGLRAPYIRARILLNIAAGAEDPLSFISVSSSYRTLEALQETGVIRFSRERLDRASKTYKRGDASFEDLSKAKMSELKTAALKTCEVFFQQGKIVTSESLAREIYPQFEKSWKLPSVKQVLGPILIQLEEAGYMHRITERWSVRSTLTEKGRIVLEEFIYPLLGLLSDDPDAIDYIDTQILPDVHQNILTYVPLALNRYYPHSRQAARERMIRADDYILDAIATRGDTVSVKQIAKELNVPYDSLFKRVIGLVNSGKLIQEKNKSRGKPDTYRIALPKDE